MKRPEKLSYRRSSLVGNQLHHSQAALCLLQQLLTACVCHSCDLLHFRNVVLMYLAQASTVCASWHCFLCMSVCLVTALVCVMSYVQLTPKARASDRQHSTALEMAHQGSEQLFVGDVYHSRQAHEWWLYEHSYTTHKAAAWRSVVPELVTGFATHCCACRCTVYILRWSLVWVSSSTGGLQSVFCVSAGELADAKGGQHVWVCCATLGSLFHITSLAKDRQFRLHTCCWT